MNGCAKRRAVLDYFVANIIDESKVSCSLCLADITRDGKNVKNFNTSNMHRHLETKHPEEFSQFQAKEKEGEFYSAVKAFGASLQASF